MNTLGMRHQAAYPEQWPWQFSFVHQLLFAE